MRLSFRCQCHALTLLEFDPQGQHLALTQKYQLMHIPFENLMLHYSWHRVIDVIPDQLFNNIVRQRRRGDTAWRITAFSTPSFSLGFKAYMVGGQIHLHAASKLSQFTTFATQLTCVLAPKFWYCRSDSRRIKSSSNRVSDGYAQSMTVSYRSSVRISVSGYRSIASTTRSLRFFNAVFQTLNYCLRICGLPMSARAIDGALIVDGDIPKWRKGGQKQWEKSRDPEAIFRDSSNGGGTKGH
ncbi:unnamed protein product [Clonostachys chloroleuca]|uniref:Uncharacterized protein n=1 Tax=Clonostachys chloroleuca TaxID=1926264 RepID=A0AA35LRC3_9HYPO|nr:unnamed protein product [Clonostachys chloroleuca]